MKLNTSKNLIMKKKIRKKGPKEGRLKIKGNWQSAVNKALMKKRPKKGWPKEKSN